VPSQFKACGGASVSLFRPLAIGFNRRGRPLLLRSRHVKRGFIQEVGVCPHIRSRLINGESTSLTLGIPSVGIAFCDYLSGGDVRRGNIIRTGMLEHALHMPMQQDD